jgi:hypothetical protein
MGLSQTKKNLIVEKRERCEPLSKFFTQTVALVAPQHSHILQPSDLIILLEWEASRGSSIKGELL